MWMAEPLIYDVTDRIIFTLSSAVQEQVENQ